MTKPISPRPLDDVLVATSLEPPSDPVVRAGAALARAAGAQLHFCHAFPLPISYLAVPSGLVDADPQMLDDARERCRALLDLQLERCGVDGGEVASATIEAGAAHRLLAKTAEEIDPGLVTLGATERRSALSSWLGSTADRVLRRVHCPLLVVRGELRVPPRRALFAIDLSELSAHALRRGLGLLTRLGGEPPELAALFVLAEEERDRGGQFTGAQMERLADEELESFLGRFDAAIAPRRRSGEPRQEILAEVEESACDLLVIGTHGRSGFERWLLGSVAADVVAGAGTSVLAVPPAEAGETS